MVQPLSILNTRGQSLDVHVNADGVIRLKLGIGEKAAAGLANVAAWQGVATHTDGATPAASDGVVLLAGHDATGNLIRKVLVDTTGRLISVLQPASGSVTNRSGTITAGGTSQDLAAANTARKYLFIQNLDSAENLWFNFTSNAVADQPSIRLGPGDSFSMEGSYVSSEKVTVIAATTGHKFTAKEA